jgi:hypothetical protein
MPTEEDVIAASSLIPVARAAAPQIACSPPPIARTVANARRRDGRNLISRATSESSICADGAGGEGVESAAGGA